MASPAKKHKRSGSVIVHPAPSPGVSRSMKKFTGPRSFGKFQAGKNKLEKKNLDTDIVAAGLTNLNNLAGSSTYCLNLLNAGNTATTAVGRRAIMKSLLLRMSIGPVVQTVLTTTGNIRVLVVYDRQPNGSLATVAAILGTTTYGTASPLNLGNSDRFTVLLDEKLSIGCLYSSGTPTNYVSEAPVPVYVDRYVKIGLPVETSSAFNGTITNISSGSIVLLAWSDNASGPVVVNAMSRVRYIDA